MKFTTDQLTEIVEVIKSNGVPLKGMPDANGAIFESTSRKIEWESSTSENAPFGYITASVYDNGQNYYGEEISDPEWHEYLTNYRPESIADGLKALRIMNVLNIQR